MSEREDLEDFERLLGRLLRIGVTLSTVALAAGLASAFLGLSATLTATLLTVGIFLLIGTPVARVVISTIVYAQRRDWTFMLLTLIVLGELVASIVAAVRGR